MNILYIGPYRLSNNLGLSSLNYLFNLCDTKHNIIARPVYTDDSSTLKYDSVCSFVSSIEQNTASHIDLLIQHIDIDNFVYTSKIEHNIFIPIIPNYLPSYYQKQKYDLIASSCMILCNQKDKIYMGHCLSSDKHEKLKTLNNTINSKLKFNTKHTFSFGLYDNYKKYYTVLNKDNVSDLKKLSIAFIKHIHLLEYSDKLQIENQNSCLVIFMQNISQEDLNLFNSIISNIYKKFNIQNCINRILIIPVSSDIESINTIHKTGDIYLDINKDINFEYSSAYNKSYIELDAEDDNNKLYDYDNLHKNGILKNNSLINYHNISIKKINDQSHSFLEIINNVL
jgi:hypothetical protein